MRDAPALSVRALSMLDQAGVKDATPESVRAWAIHLTGEADPPIATINHYLRRQKNVGERTANELFAFAWGIDKPRPATLRLECSVCGDRAELKASGGAADKFTQWWASEHRHERTKED